MIKIKMYGTASLLVVYVGVKLGLSDKGKTQVEVVQERVGGGGGRGSFFSLRGVKKGEKI